MENTEHILEVTIAGVKYPFWYTWDAHLDVAAQFPPTEFHRAQISFVLAINEGLKSKGRTGNMTGAKLKKLLREDPGALTELTDALVYYSEQMDNPKRKLKLPGKS